MRNSISTNRGPLAGFAIGVATVILFGSGAAVAAQTNLVQVVNQLLSVSVKNTDAEPVPVKLPERTPFQLYVHVPPEGVDLGTVPPGQRLVITYINSRLSDGDFLALRVDDPDMLWFEWNYRDGAVDTNPLIYVGEGGQMRLFEGSTLDANPFVTLSGYYEPAP